MDSFRKYVESADIHDVFGTKVSRQWLLAQIRDLPIVDEITTNIPIDQLVATQASLGSNEPRSSNPIDVVKWANRYFVIEGHHRVAKAKREGKRTIVAHVFEYGAQP
jgi:uncharacterized ParB-like nuclease family protein